MTRDELLKKLTAGGCVFLRHGGRHDIWRNPRTGQKQPVPRHREMIISRGTSSNTSA